MKYEKLTEVKEFLDREGIKYQEVEIGEAEFVWTKGLMQIQNPTKKQRDGFWPEVRISKHEGDKGYYVKACGVIHENQTLDDIMYLIKTFC